MRGARSFCRVLFGLHNIKKKKKKRKERAVKMKDSREKIEYNLKEKGRKKKRMS